MTSWMRSRAVLTAAAGTAGLLWFASPSHAGNLTSFNGLPVRSTPHATFYPPTLIRLHVSGRVVLAYSVDASGQPQKVVVLVSDDPRLERPASDYIYGFRFDPPKTWLADGGPWRRFHLQVTFAFEGDPPLPSLLDDIEGATVVITTTGIKRPSP